MAFVGMRHAVLCRRRPLGKRVQNQANATNKQELDFTVSFRKVTPYTGRALSIRASDLQSKRSLTTDGLIMVVDIINISTCRVENAVRGI